MAQAPYLPFVPLYPSSLSYPPPPPDPSLVLPPCHSLAGAYCVARNILLGHLQCQRLGEARDA